MHGITFLEFYPEFTMELITVYFLWFHLVLAVYILRLATEVQA